MTLRGREAMSEYYRDVLVREMTHRIEGEVLGEGRGAFDWAYECPDVTRVLAAATVELRDGEIVRQVVVEASDEYPQGTRSLP